jgi:formate hydrogenlyase transcriptional activator
MSNLFQSYDWPGNIRELQNVIERAVIVSDSEMLSIDERWLAGQRSPTPPTVRPHPSARWRLTRRTLSRRRSRKARAACSAPLGAAARLGVPPSTLESKIKALKIDKRRQVMSRDSRGMGV